MSATNRGAKKNTFDFYTTPQEPIDKIPNHIEKQYAEIQKGKDYLKVNFKSDLIVTNPPFSLALEFLEKSLREAEVVVYLLRLNFLGSQKRKPFWEKNPPSHIFVLSKRPSFTGKGTDATEYAWFVWDKKGAIKRDRGIYVL